MSPQEGPFKGRIKSTIERGGGAAAMSRLTGIPLGTMKKYAAESSVPSFVNASKIALAAGLPLEVMAFGLGVGIDQQMGAEFQGDKAAQLKASAESIRAKMHSPPDDTDEKAPLTDRLDPAAVPETEAGVNHEGPTVFVGFMSEIFDLVIRVRSEANSRLNPHQVMSEATRWATELIDMAKDIHNIDELRSFLPWIEGQVRREIAAAKSEPGTGKRSA